MKLMINNFKLLLKAGLRSGLTSFSTGELNLGKSSKVLGSRLSGSVTIADGARLYKSFISGKVSIGRWSVLNGPNIAIIGGVSGVYIGNFCSIARDVFIQDFGHDYKRVSTFYMAQRFFSGSLHDDVTSRGPVVIGNDVWVGKGAVILSGITIGDGAVIGANSVVTKDVPPYSIVAGVPAVVIKKRFSEDIIEKIASSKWWLWSDSDIKKNYNFFCRYLDE